MAVMNEGVSKSAVGRVTKNWIEQRAKQNVDGISY